MKKKEDRVFLLHIRDSILKILKYREGVSYSEFIEDTSIQDSVIRQLEVTKNLSKEFRDSHPEVPWKVISGTRDKLIHAYFDVDFDEVWQVAQEDILILKKDIERILNE